jgi:hypothetical protein
MRELRLVAVSDDGTRLILEGNDSESRMTLPIDERVHAAIRGDRARLGQLEIQQDSKLRPRDIQARVRSGESVESVAAAANVPLDKVMRFAGPVLAERQHVAERAQGAVIRGASAEVANRPLLESVGAWVSRSDVDPESVEWDAWRRDDGKWQVVARWSLGEKSQRAEFTFDPTGRSVVPDDDEARGVAGETVQESAAPPAPPAPVNAGPARLSVVTTEDDTTDQADDEVQAEARPLTVVDEPADDTDDDMEQPADEELDEPVPPPAARGQIDDDQPTMPVPVTARRPPRSADARRLRNERRRKPRNEPAASTGDRLRLTDIASKVEVEGEPAPNATGRAAAANDRSARPAPAAERTAPTPEERPVKRSGSAKSKRPAVPSWDEIMFGRRDNPE